MQNKIPHDQQIELWTHLFDSHVRRLSQAEFLCLLGLFRWTIVEGAPSLKIKGEDFSIKLNISKGTLLKATKSLEEEGLIEIERGKKGEAFGYRLVVNEKNFKEIH